MGLGLAELIVISLIVDWLFRRLAVPGLVGMLLVGIVLGPYVLGWLSPQLLAVSSDLRMIALIVILLRAGFELSKDTLKKVGLRAVLLSFVPALFEAASATFLAHYFLKLDYLASAILGTILGAVSPAVVVPLMIKFIEERRGVKKGIPTLVLAASSIDDVFVIVLYSVLIGIYLGTKVNIVYKVLSIPLSITLGIVLGIASGLFFYQIFLRFNPRATKRLLVILGASIIFVALEHALETKVPFAALLAVMAMGFIILEKDEYMASELSRKLSKLWVFAEILLFTLVGAQVNVKVALNAGAVAALVIALGLVGRSLGTYLCLIKSNFNFKERMFIIISYLPKATVQAAIGGAPLLALKMSGRNTYVGEVILAVAVLSIILTAPLGAWAIMFFGRKFLTVDIKGKKPNLSFQDVASEFKVSEAMEKDVPCLKKNDDLHKIVSCLSQSSCSFCPVIDEKGKYLGAVDLAAVKSVLDRQEIWPKILAADLLKDKLVLKTSDKLSDFLKSFARSQNLEAVVVDENKKLSGVILAERAEKFIEERLYNLRRS